MEETLGKRIAKNRKRLGLTQDRLAELLGVTAQAVSKWENDQSCPDINTLPKLAGIFGITTDELLGNPRVVETAVDEEDDAPAGTVEVNLGPGRKGSLSLAVWILVLGGVSLLLNLLHRDQSFGTVFWSSALFVFGIFGIYPKFSVFRMGCAAAGAYLLAGCFVELPGLGWPVILIILGILLLIRALQTQKAETFRFHPWPNVKVKGKTNAFHADGEHFECRTSFGEKENVVNLPKLSTGYAEVQFGSMTVDLRGCGEIADGARITMDCSFGELNLLVPASCRVENNVSTGFGDFKISGQPNQDADRILYVEGDVSFGEGSVRYV